MAINYTEVGWDTTKYVNPTNMNQMDDGIKAACDGVDALETEVEELVSGKAFLYRVGNLRFLRFFGIGPTEMASITLGTSDRPSSVIQGVGYRCVDNAYYTLAFFNIYNTGAVEAFIASEYNTTSGYLGFASAGGIIMGEVCWSV